MIDEVGIARRSPYALALLRIVTGLIFLEHGTQKFLGFPAGEYAGSGLALDNPAAFAGIVEIVAGSGVDGRRRAEEQTVAAMRRARAGIPADAALQMAARLRESGLEVDYRTLPGLSHGDTLGGSLPIMLRGIAGLEHGHEAMRPVAPAGP